MTRWIVENAAPNLVDLVVEVRAPRHLAHHHAHEIGVVAPRPEKDLGDPPQLLVGGLGRALDAGEAPEQLPPVLTEQRCQDLLLGREVVVEQTVRDTRLLGDVSDARRVIPTPGEDPDRSVEDETALLLARRLPIPSGALICDRTLSQSGRRIRRFADDVPWKANCIAQRPVRPSATGSWKRSVMRSASAG